MNKQHGFMENFWFLKWRDRLVDALNEMKVGGLAEPALRQVCKINGSVLEEKDDSSVVKVFFISILDSLVI